jgi:hypothetical protein
MFALSSATRSLTANHISRYRESRESHRNSITMVPCVTYTLHTRRRWWIIYCWVHYKSCFQCFDVLHSSDSVWGYFVCCVYEIGYLIVIVIDLKRVRRMDYAEVVESVAESVAELKWAWKSECGSTEINTFGVWSTETTTCSWSNRLQIGGIRSVSNSGGRFGHRWTVHQLTWATRR